MAGAEHIRISDQDRERAAAAIREHFAAGRLDGAEFEERLQAIYAARTRGELDALAADLPALPVTPAEARAIVVQARSEISRRAMQNAGGSFAPFLVCTVIWAASGAGSFFWPIFLLIGPVGMFARVGWALYGPAPDLEAAERELSSHRRDGRAGGRRDRGRRRRY
jgi:hypothetical protein